MINQLRKNASDARNMTLEELIARCITGENGTMAQAIAEKCEEIRGILEDLDKFARKEWADAKNLEYTLEGVNENIEDALLRNHEVDEETLALWQKSLLEDTGRYKPSDAHDEVFDWQDHFAIPHRVPKTLDDHTTTWLAKHDPRLK